MNRYTDIKPSDRRFTVNQARRLFLEAISKNAPEVLQDLITIEFSSLQPLNRKSVVLQSWATYWNLNADWILETAYQTIETRYLYKRQLEFEQQYPSPSRIALIESYKANGLISGKEKPTTIDEFLNSVEVVWQPSVTSWEMSNMSDKIKPPVSLPTWKADFEPRAIYLERVKNTISDELKNGMFSDLPKTMRDRIKDVKQTLVANYCDKVIKEYLDLKDSSGNALWIGTNDKPNLERNALWTVKFQVLKQDYSDIAEVEPSTVSRAVANFLDLIELRKRNTSRGRRIGQTLKKIEDKRFERYGKD